MSSPVKFWTKVIIQPKGLHTVHVKGTWERQHGVKIINEVLLPAGNMKKNDMVVLGKRIIAIS